MSVSTERLRGVTQGFVRGGRLISRHHGLGDFMRAITALALVSAFAGHAVAEDAQAACSMTDAVYTDGNLGFELRFRKGESWELYGMMTSVMELRMPDGRELWGYIHANMGTSRDEGSLYYGCKRPGPEDAPLTSAEIDECRVWNNNVYALVDGKAEFVPNEGEAAPPSLLLADIGRTLRYTVLTGPGDEPWDQFFLTGCGE